MTEMNKQKGFANLALVFVMIIAIAAGVYLIKQGTDYLSKAKTSTDNLKLPSTQNQMVTEADEDINNEEDLKDTLANLDSIDVEALSEYIEANKADESGL